MSKYDSNYPKKKIGHGNPYYCCLHCGVSDPQINGQLKNHLSTCEYRIKKETVPTYSNISSQEKEKILEMTGWTIECESPLEIRHEDGSFATLNAAKEVMEIVIKRYLKTGEI